MSSTRARTSQSVSLFPFLAVLMCTMGALILLLIVTSRRIRREAVARSKVRSDPLQPVPVEERPLPPVAAVRPRPARMRSVSRPAEAGHYEPVVPQLPTLRPVVKAPAETDRIVAEHNASIVRTNAKRKAKLARLRAQLQAIAKVRDDLNRQLAAARQRNNAARDKLQRLQASQSALTNSAVGQAQQVGALKDNIRSTATAIDGIRRKLALLKLQQANASSEFAIVPYDGSTGTTRRPIFIECTKESIRFVPEGVEITAADLLGFTADRNPLLAGAQRLLHYWTAQARVSNNPNEPQPYVLLLVRPGGSVAYYAARKMLQSLNSPVGYELIEADWKLHLPPFDPRAKAVCEQAVNRTRLHRRRVISSFAPGPLTSPLGGTPGRVMRFNRSTGRFEVVQNENKPSLGPFEGIVDEDDDSRSTGRSFRGSGGRGRPGTNDGTAAASSARSRPGSSPDGTGHFQRSGDTFGNRSANGHPLAEGRSTLANGGTPIGNGNRFSRDPGRMRRGSPIQGRDSKSSERSASSQGRSPQNGKDIGNATAASGNGRQHLWPLNRNGAGGNSGEPGNGGNETTGDPDGVPDTGLNGNSSNRRRSSRSTGSRSFAETGGSSQNSSTSQDWQSTGQRGAGGPQSGGADSTRGIGLFGSSGGRPRRYRQRRLWGLSSPSATIGFEREVAIAVTTDRLIVQGRQTIRVGKGETRDELVQQVVTAVDRAVRSWGKPPESFYWVPTLRFVISPGGNRHYERMAGPVKKFGLQSVAEYRLDSPPERKGR